MPLISAFADEIDPSLDVQLATLARLNIPGLDLRSVDGVKVLNLEDHTLRQVRAKCEAQNVHVQAIGSPVNKVDFTAENQPKELEKLRRAIHAAELTGTKRIRIFTPEGSDEAGILEWMEEQIDLAKSAGVILLHENDAKYWGAYPANAKTLFAKLGSPTFRMAFDFANTVLLGFSPWDDWMPWILPYLDTLHIKDAKDGSVVPAGQGDARMKECIDWLFEQGWDGPLTLEPHLHAAGPFGGFSGPELFEVAANALRAVLA